MYEIIENELGMQTIKFVAEDGSILWISDDPNNLDYQVYLASLEETTA